jgi:hypothetical protein
MKIGLEPVTYQEAFECFKNGGTIMVRLNQWERKYNSFVDLDFDSISWKSIFLGQWFILSE